MDEKINILCEYEGLSIQEAKLTYAERQDLPANAFCGPDRSYPANDAAHVRNGFARLGTFGKRLPHSVAAHIYGCLVRRAKRFGVEHDSAKFGWLTGKKSVQETLQEIAEKDKNLLEWYYTEIGIKK